MDISDQAKNSIHISNHQGVTFYDFGPLLSNCELLKEVCDAIAKKARNFNQVSGSPITKVAGLESRGFIIGPLIAQCLGVGFVMIRKVGKLPKPVISQDYEKEYGTDTIEIATGRPGSVTSTDVVLIVDDVLATGGTAVAAKLLIEHTGATVAGFGFVLELPNVVQHGDIVTPRISCVTVQ